VATQAQKSTWLDLTIDANEELGVIDTLYLEDYYGVDGHLTLVHQTTSQEFDIVMADVVGGGAFAHDHYEGTRDATTMPLGSYEVRGQVRDVIGNRTIITAIQTPVGGERVISLIFDLVEVLIRKLLTQKVAIVRAIRDTSAVTRKITDKVDLA